MTAAAGPGPARTPAGRKARQLARYLRAERPDYAYLKDVFRYLRAELDIEVTRAPKKLPYVPTEAEIRAFYDAVWKARRASDVILVKTLLYTGVRVAELVRIRIADVDLDACRIRIVQGKGGKDRVVPFPAAFKETLALHIDARRRAGAGFLFESSWKKPYSDRGVRKILARYTQAAGITASISPHQLDPGHRRRAHPALQRPRHPPVPGDLLPPRPRRRSAALRRCHRRLSRLTNAITLVWGW